MITLQGKCVSAGIAVGKLVFLDRSAFVVEKKAISDVAGEIQRFHAARQSAAEQLDTNDLTQYTLAVDRQNESIAEFCDSHHEAIIRMIRLTCENAHKAGIWCGICGMLGGDMALTKTFIDMGIDELSVEPSYILKLRHCIAQS
jgi:phosphoenolpyruvate-protein kinase (PTS system EI component)